MSGNGKKSAPKFAMIPFELLADSRLSARDWRVYGVIAAHANSKGDAWLKRNTIAIEAATFPSKVSESTARLVEFRLLAKRQNSGGRSAPAHYRLIRTVLQKTVTDPGRVSSTKTVTGPVTVSKENRHRAGTKTVTDPGRGKEHTYKQIGRPLEENESNRGGTRWNLDAVPSEWISWAVETEGLTPHQAEREAAKFCDHWRAASGSNATKLDWAAAWRNWIRRSRDDFRRRDDENGAAPDPEIEALKRRGAKLGLASQDNEPWPCFRYRVESSERGALIPDDNWTQAAEKMRRSNG